MPDKFIMTKKEKHSRARFPLVVTWLLLGYIITMGIKSVLSASWVIVQHEKPVETLEDLLNTDRKILMLANTSTAILLKTDPRPGIQQMAKKVTWLPYRPKSLLMAKSR